MSWQNSSISFFGKKCDFGAVQKSALYRSRRKLSNAYLLAKFGVDTAKNEPCQVCPIVRDIRVDLLVRVPHDPPILLQHSFRFRGRRRPGVRAAGRASCQSARGVVLARPVPRKFAIRWLRGAQRHVRFRKCELVAVDVRPEPLQWRKGGLCFF